MNLESPVRGQLPLPDLIQAASLVLISGHKMHDQPLTKLIFEPWVMDQTIWALHKVRLKGTSSVISTKKSQEGNGIEELILI